MGNSMNMKPKGVFRGYLELSKKSKNTSKCWKLNKIQLVQVWEIWRSAWREILNKFKFSSNGPKFLWSKLVLDIIHDLKIQLHALNSFNLFLIKSFKFNLNKIKCKEWSHGVLGLFSKYLEVQGSPRKLANSCKMH